MKELISSIRNLPRHFITAVQSIWRNGVMSVSSIFAVTITLVLVAAVGAIALNIQEMTTSIEKGVRIYVKLERNIDETGEQEVGNQIKALDHISEVTFYTKDQELTRLIEGWEDGADVFESYREDNPLGAAYEVKVTDSEYIDQVTNQINGILNVNSASYGGESTGTMLGTLETVRTVGMVVVVGLVIIALLMIANTIKITITSRQTEISIMRMVGASNWYIRLPFMLEGMLIGLIGAILPIIIVVYGYNFIYSFTNGSLATAMLPLLKPYPFIRDLSLALAGLGSGVGLIGSYVSIRRFLKF
ncbi:MAG: permease-like cell division protein FtsX [Coprobacillaceae bacterium]